MELTSFEPNKQLLLGMTLESIKERKPSTVEETGQEEKQETTDAEPSTENKEDKQGVAPEPDFFFSITPVLLSCIDFTYHSKFDSFLQPSLPAIFKPTPSLKFSSLHNLPPSFFSQGLPSRYLPSRKSTSVPLTSTPWSPLVVTSALQVLINFTVDSPALIIDFLCTKSECIKRLMDFILDHRHWKCKKHQEWGETKLRQSHKRKRGNDTKNDNPDNDEVDENEDVEGDDFGDEGILVQKALSVLYNMMSFPDLVHDKMTPFLAHLIEISLSEGEGSIKCEKCQISKQRTLATLNVLLGL